MDSLAEYIVSVGDRNRKARLLKISLEKTASIELEGRAMEITFPKTVSFDKEIAVFVNGRKYSVKLNKDDRPMAFNVEVNGKPFALRLETKRRELDGKMLFAIPSPSVIIRERSLSKKSGAVTSPMSGKVVLVRVKIGNKVKVGDPLCVLEAMKMENEIIAPKNGIVKQVEVEKDSIVKKGELLVVIE